MSDDDGRESPEIDERCSNWMIPDEDEGDEGKGNTSEALVGFRSYELPTVRYPYLGPEHYIG